MQDFAVLLGAIAALSLTVTKVVDFVRNLPYFKNPDGSAKYAGSWIWNVLAVVVGLAISLGWSVNIAGDAAKLVPALAGTAENLTGTSGEILTGLVIGAGAGFFHELLDSLSSIANRNNAVV